MTEIKFKSFDGTMIVLKHGQTLTIQIPNAIKDDYGNVAKFVSYLTFTNVDGVFTMISDKPLVCVDPDEEKKETKT